jgi:hypothetical protein
MLVVAVLQERCSTPALCRCCLQLSCADVASLCTAGRAASALHHPVEAPCTCIKSVYMQQLSMCTKPGVGWKIATIDIWWVVRTAHHFIPGCAVKVRVSMPCTIPQKLQVPAHIMECVKGQWYGMGQHSRAGVSSLCSITCTCCTRECK